MATFRDFILQTKDMIGLEIGGPSEIFSAASSVPIYPLAKRIDNCTFALDTDWGLHTEGWTFQFNENKAPGYQYQREMTDLVGIIDSAYDFVCSSHALEHCANPIKALIEFARVLKDRGYLILVLPHKDGTFDRLRPVTSLDHLVSDFRNDVGEDDLTHLEEILALHDPTADVLWTSYDAFRARSMNNHENRGLHHHVFDTALAVSLVNHCGFQLRFVAHSGPHHVVIIAQKLGLADVLDNSGFLSTDAPCYVNSLFPSDRNSRMASADKSGSPKQHCPEAKEALAIDRCKGDGVFGGPNLPTPFRIPHAFVSAPNKRNS